MKILSAVNARVPPTLSLTSTALGAVKCDFAKNELDVLGTLEPMLPRCTEFLNDCLCAPAHFPHVNADRPTVNAILGSAPSQISYAALATMLFVGVQPRVDTGAANIFPFDNGGSATGTPNSRASGFAA